MQSLVSKLLNAQTHAACLLDIEGARLAGIVIRAMDEKRSAALSQYDVVRAQKKREKRDLLNLKAKERKKAIDAVVRIDVTSAVLCMSEPRIREQLKNATARVIL